MKIEVSLRLVLIVLSLLVWLSTIYIKIVIRQLRRQLISAQDIAAIGKPRCESASKGLSVMNIFYKVVTTVLVLLSLVFVVDEIARAVALKGRSFAMEHGIINTELLLGILAFSGFWYMVREVHGYNVALVNKCKELMQ